VIPRLGSVKPFPKSVADNYLHLRTQRDVFRQARAISRDLARDFFGERGRVPLPSHGSVYHLSSAFSIVFRVKDHV